MSGYDRDACRAAWPGVPDELLDGLWALAKRVTTAANLASPGHEHLLGIKEVGDAAGRLAAALAARPDAARWSGLRVDVVGRVAREAAELTDPKVALDLLVEAAQSRYNDLTGQIGASLRKAMPHPDDPTTTCDAFDGPLLRLLTTLLDQAGAPKPNRSRRTLGRLIHKHHQEGWSGRAGRRY